MCTRSKRGGALLFSVAIIVAICVLTMLATLCVCDIASQGYYNDKTKLLAINTLRCYNAETYWYTMGTGAPAAAQSMVQSELNDALGLMGMPNGTVTISNPAPTILTSQVSVTGISGIGGSGLFPTLLSSSQSVSLPNPYFETIRATVVIPTASGNFSTPTCGALGSIAVTPAIPAYSSPLEAGTFCQANFFQYQLPYDEYDLIFSQYYHQCPMPNCCGGSPCSFLVCGGSHAGPPPVPTGPPVPFEKCEMNP